METVKVRDLMTTTLLSQNDRDDGEPKHRRFAGRGRRGRPIGIVSYLDALRAVRR
jgi:hypothetical protein